jgi:hypothetical protein
MMRHAQALEKINDLLVGQRRVLATLRQSKLMLEVIGPHRRVRTVSVALPNGIAEDLLEALAQVLGRFRLDRPDCLERSHAQLLGNMADRHISFVKRWGEITLDLALPLPPKSLVRDALFELVGLSVLVD